MTSPHGAFTDYNKLSPVKSFAPLPPQTSSLAHLQMWECSPELYYLLQDNNVLLIYSATLHHSFI